MSDIGFKGKVPGAWRVPTDFRLTDRITADLMPTILHQELAFFIPNAVSGEDCARLRALFASQEAAPVAVSGYQTADPNEIGSVRATGWGPELASQLWRKIDHIMQEQLPRPVYMDDFTPTDWFGIPNKRAEHLAWKATGISPVLRFMEYKAGGKHNTHYDMGFDYEAHDPNDKRRTLLSIVWYLNDEPDTGGCTRFIEDHQGHLPIQQRNLDDWVRSASDDEVIAAKTPQQGGALLFWHRMAHDVQEFTGKSRIIIRGDIEFTALD